MFDELIVNLTKKISFIHMLKMLHDKQFFIIFKDILVIKTP